MQAKKQMNPNDLIRKKAGANNLGSINPVSFVHFSLCAAVNSWIPYDEFMNLDIDVIHDTRECAIMVNEEMKKRHK